MKSTTYYFLSYEVKGLYKVLDCGRVWDIKETYAYEPMMYVLKHIFYPYIPVCLRNKN